VSTLLIPGSGNPNYDTAEGGDPYEGRKGRREREVRSLLEKLEPSTITIDPEMLGNMKEEGKIDESLVHRKQPRMERLRVAGKADENEVPEDEEPEEDETDRPHSERREKKKKKMRGKDKSMKRYLKKKRKNVIDEATV
jgi:U3 small nucleolar RNA-associated protein 7